MCAACAVWWVSGVAPRIVYFAQCGVPGIARQSSGADVCIGGRGRRFQAWFDTANAGPFLVAGTRQWCAVERLPPKKLSDWLQIVSAVSAAAISFWLRFLRKEFFKVA